MFKMRDTPVFVEYDGSFFHKEKVDKDVEKTKNLLKHGLVIRFREQSGQISLPLLPIEHENLFQRQVEYGDKEAMDSFVQEAVEWVQEKLGKPLPNLKTSDNLKLTTKKEEQKP